MIKKYIAIEHKNSRYWKGVPYISKKEFKKNKNNLIIGKTKLKKYKSSSENKELDLLLFNNKEFEIKERLFGFKKGYVFVGDDKYIALKRRIPFLFLLLLLLIVFIMFRFLIPCNNQEDKPIVVPVQKRRLILRNQIKLSHLQNKNYQKNIKLHLMVMVDMVAWNLFYVN